MGECPRCKGVCIETERREGLLVYFHESGEECFTLLK